MFLPGPVSGGLGPATGAGFVERMVRCCMSMILCALLDTFDIHPMPYCTSGFSALIVIGPTNQRIVSLPSRIPPALRYVGGEVEHIFHCLICTFLIMTVITAHMIFIQHF